MDILNNHILERENKSPCEGGELLTISVVGHTAEYLYSRTDTGNGSHSV
jgi:hypothetical protein